VAGQQILEVDLDRFLGYFNLERSHQGYRLQGRTSARPAADHTDRGKGGAANHRTRRRRVRDASGARCRRMTQLVHASPFGQDRTRRIIRNHELRPRCHHLRLPREVPTL